MELVWWEGCPSTEPALEMLRSALGELGLGATEVQMVEVHSDEEAREQRFPGSPTIRIDGVDLEAVLGRGAELEPASLTCRVYRRRDGRISPTPDPADVREALQRAAEPREAA